VSGQVRQNALKAFITDCFAFPIAIEAKYYNMATRGFVCKLMWYFGIGAAFKSVWGGVKQILGIDIGPRTHPEGEVQ
jgi:hypothetical protein